MRGLTTIIAIFSWFLIQAQSKVLQSPEPIWVERYAYNNIVVDTSGTSNGYIYLLVSLQNHIELKEYYGKYAIKVVSEHGLSVASSINESFDPSYEKITFHSLNIIRNGKKINKMDVRKFEVIRREEEMSRSIYDKTLNAVYNLPDVRVGDIVEYSFSKKGSNPAFGDHAFGTFYLQYSVPVGKFAHRLIVDNTKPLRFKSFGNTGSFEGVRSGKFTNYEIIQENVKAILADDQLPSWYDAYAHVQYTDFNSWNEVKVWALQLYKQNHYSNKALHDLVKEISAMQVSDEEKIKECIRIVQADIRYLSFSDGIHGYKPHSPGLVLEQKYGDCKDKSYLLTYLLNKVGVESYPALVSTESGEILNDILPNPWAFNHCIVQLIFKDSSYWIDPTLNAQLGYLKNYSFPSYKNALIINSKANGLDSIPFGYKNSKIDVLEEYSMDEVGGYVTLKVKSKFYGDEADEIRDYTRTNTKEEIHKAYLNFYAKDYSEISLRKDVEFNDEKVENLIISHEEYQIKNFWNLDQIKGKTASIYASVLSSYIKKPETKLRTMPLRVVHPREVYQTIKIYLPEEWDESNYQNAIESDGFSYHSSSLYNDKIITLRYSYKTKASYVKSESTVDHINKIDEVLNDLSYTISKPFPTKSGNKDFQNYFILVLIVGVAFYYVRKTYKK